MRCDLLYVEDRGQRTEYGVKEIGCEGCHVYRKKQVRAGIVSRVAGGGMQKGQRVCFMY